MSIKSIITKYSFASIIHFSIYGLNIIIIIILFVYINNNIFKTINVQEDDLKSQINEVSKDIDIKKFNAVVEKINSKKTTKPLIDIGEIF